MLVGESKSTLDPSLFRRHHCPVLENECENGERIANDCDGNSTTFFLFFSSSVSSRSLEMAAEEAISIHRFTFKIHTRATLCLNQSCSQILSPTRPSLSLSLSLSRSLGTGRREPWERGCVYTCPKDVKYTCPNVRPCMLSS